MSTVIYSNFSVCLNFLKTQKELPYNENGTVIHLLRSRQGLRVEGRLEDGRVLQQRKSMGARLSLGGN